MIKIFLKLIAHKKLFFFVLQNMTGGSKGGLHITDITNASRTMFLNLKTQAWDPYLCK